MSDRPETKEQGASEAAAPPGRRGAADPCEPPEQAAEALAANDAPAPLVTAGQPSAERAAESRGDEVEAPPGATRAPESPATTPSDVASAATDDEAQTSAAARQNGTTEALEKVLNRFEVGVGRLRGDLAERLGAIDESLADLAKQVSYVPPQVRNLGGRIDSLTTSISESRYRALLLDLLRIMDLVDQVHQGGPAGSAGGPAAAEFRRVIDVVATQIRQVLLMNGLSEIPTDGPFDSQIHCAVRSVPCTDPALDGRIHKAVRTGWRTEHSVLRFADVEVYRGEPAGTAAEPEVAAQKTADADGEPQSPAPEAEVAAKADPPTEGAESPRDAAAVPPPGETTEEGSAGNGSRPAQP